MGDSNGWSSDDQENEQDIAIIGLSCRFAGDAKDPKGFWDLLCQAKSAHSRTARFDNTSNTNYAGYHLQDDVYNFDTNFFEISPREAKAMDPCQRLMLEVAFEAFEGAGLSLETVASSNTSCYAAQFGTDYREMLARDCASIPKHTFTGTGTTMLSNRLSWFFDLKGPSFTLNTACSASLVALHEGCKSLRYGESDMSLIAAANLILSPDMFIYARSQNFLSPDGKCKSFDIAGDGYGRGEGVSALILKPVSAAVRDGDPIRAIIRGSGVNQNGRMKGITVPSVDAQKTLIEKTYRSAKLGFEETAYVEAHGPGTKRGDPVELEALGRTLGQSRQEGKLLVGSVKPNVGHTEATAGLAGVIKSVLALETGLIPPNIYLEQPNPNIKFDEWNLSVPTELTSWPTGYALRRISACSTGYGGTNAHIILDDAYHYLARRGFAKAIHFTAPPSQIHKSLSNGVNGLVNGTKDSSDCADALLNRYRQQLIILSANDEGGVERQLGPLAQYCGQAMEKHQDEADLLRRLAFTLNCKRSRLTWSASVIASSLKDIQTALETLQHSGTPCTRKSAENPGVCFVFVGQGAQWAKMGQVLYEEFNVFRESLDAAEAFFADSLGCQWSVTTEMFREASASHIEDPELAQPLTAVLQIALVDLLESWNVVPDWIVGHSSGEIAGAYCLGALKRTQAWTIAYYRGVFKPDQEGAMMAVGMPVAEAETFVAEHARGKVAVACINSPQSITLSGNTDYIEKLQQILQDRKVYAQRLKVRTAYHSHHMQRVAADYASVLSDLQPKDAHPGRKMFSAVTGLAVAAKDLGPSYWVKNMVSTVRFSDAVEALLASCGTEPRMFVEIGPHHAMQAPLKQIFAKAGLEKVEYTSILVRDTDAISTALTAVGRLYGAGVPVNVDTVNNRRQEQSEQEPRLLVDLPPYAWKHDQSYNAVTPAAEASSIVAPAVEADSAVAAIVEADSAITATKPDTRCICTAVEWHPAPELISCDLSALKSKQKQVILLLPAQLSDPLSSMLEKIIEQLHVLGFQASTINWPTKSEHIQGRKCISLVDLAEPMFLDATAQDFDALRDTVLECDTLLWLSSDSASGTIIPGLARTVRNEVPGISFRSLQLGSGYIDHSDSLSKTIAKIVTSTVAENEFREENGKLLVPRVKKDEETNEKIRGFLPGNVDKPVQTQVSDGSKKQLPSDATYILAGGLGGIGRSLANFLVDLGARHICFVSRSGSESSSAQKLLTELRQRDVHASSYKGDVSNMESLQLAIDQCSQEHPPIRGIIQCAMVLQDVLFSKMTHTQWQKAMRPKVQGSSNLAQVMPSDADFFIMLSSFTGTFGNRTQGNYVAACAFQDGLAYECRARGQNAVALDLGVMRDVGYLAEHGSVGSLKEWEEHFGVREWELKALVHAAIAGETPTQTIAGLPSAKDAEEAGIMPPFYLRDPKFSLMAATEVIEGEGEGEGEEASKTPKKPTKKPADLKTSISNATTRDEVKQNISQAFRTIVAKFLQASQDDIDMSQSLHSQGADSLVVIEVQGWLYQQINVNISQNDFMTDGPMSELVDQIMSKCEHLPTMLKA